MLNRDPSEQLSSLVGARARGNDAIIFNGTISRDGRTMLVTRGVQARDAFLITNFH